MNFQVNQLNTYSNNLDLIRFFLASCVCFTHSFNLLYGDNTDPLGVATGVIGLGGTAVDMFFLISGYLVCKSWILSQGFKRFIAKRLLRIYPGFIGVTLICGFIFAPIGAENLSDYFRDFDFFKFIRRALQLELPEVPDTLPGVAFPNEINGSLWTIKYEFVCYLLIALLGVLSILHNRIAVLFIFIITFSIFVFQSYFDPLLLFIFIENKSLPRLLGEIANWPRFATFFLAGAVFYLYRDFIPHSRIVLIISVFAWLLLTFKLKMPNLAMPIFGGYILFYLAFNQTIKLSNFGKYGDFSYGLYLYAFPIQQLLALYFAKNLNGLSMFVTSFIITLMFAIMSWHLIEKPFLKLKSRQNTSVNVDKILRREDPIT